MRLMAVTLALFLGLAPPMARAEGAADVAAFRVATGLAQGGDWVAAEAALADAGLIARDVLRWMRLRDGPRAADAAPDPRDPDPSFVDYAVFLAAHPHWPGLDRLRLQGERTIPPDAAAAAVLAYFEGGKPQTGEGAAALARALLEQGQTDAARAVVEEAWLTLGLTARGQAAVLAGWADALAPLHQARADAMLWRWRTGDAERMLPFLSADQRLLAEARIALIRNASDRNARVAAVPEALRDDPGLAADRFNRLADDGDYTDAVALLLGRTGDAARLGDPFRWGSWRATLARWSLREGRPDQAYRLAAQHHIDPAGQGRDFYADLEWIAGYVALRHLNDPATALTHFRRMEAAVSGPISLARAAYWTGRAEEAAGLDPGASYTRAAQNQTAFYGLLAAERLGLPLDPALTGREDFGDWRSGAILRSDLTAAMLMLVAADNRNDALLFVAKHGQTLSRGDVGQLGTLLIEAGEPFLALILSKAAVERGILIPALHYPVHPMARIDLPVATDLALSIARQESEFNTAAGSGVGALGLMQLMPGTAEEVARDLGLPYERARLTTDWDYNARLGAAYLAGLEATFGRTPVMIAAGYNAGPSRPRTWMAQRGDPRRGEVDVIDWIESIPFTETRNYVMRVTEAMPVYRARLTGQAGTVDFLSLLVGEPPRVRPQARPDRSAAAMQDAVAAALGASLPAGGGDAGAPQNNAPGAAIAVPPATSVAATPPSAASGGLAPSVALRPVARP